MVATTESISQSIDFIGRTYLYVQRRIVSYTTVGNNIPDHKFYIYYFDGNTEYLLNEVNPVVDNGITRKIDVSALTNLGALTIYFVFYNNYNGAITGTNHITGYIGYIGFTDPDAPPPPPPTLHSTGNPTISMYPMRQGIGIPVNGGVIPWGP